MTRNERLAWKRFQEECARHAQGALDGCVPVALIAMPIKMQTPTDSGLVIDVAEGEPRIVWIRELTEEDKKHLVHVLNEGYRTGVVLK